MHGVATGPQTREARKRWRDSILDSGPPQGAAGAPEIALAGAVRAGMGGSPKILRDNP
jgi:hypothetical protein